MEPDGRPHVLVVDDDQLVLSGWGRLLGRRYRVELAEGGRKALSMLLAPEAFRFDAIFTDIAMPDLDGVALYRAIEAQSAPLARRMIFLTGGSTDPIVTAFLDTVPWLFKPAPLDQVDRRLREVMARSATEAAA